MVNKDYHKALTNLQVTDKQFNSAAAGEMSITVTAMVITRNIGRSHFQQIQTSINV